MNFVYTKRFSTLQTFVVLSSLLILNFCASTTMALNLSQSISDFTTSLYQTSIESTKDNVIMSPFSVLNALALAYAGSAGETAKVLAAGLKLGITTPDKVAAGFNTMLQTLSKLDTNTTLDIANKIYVMEKYEISKVFQDAAVQFHSAVDELNFADNINAAKTINKWVEDKTNKKIQNLVSADVLDQDTRLVLVNAIYFKGLWEHPFKKEHTVKAPFWTSETDSVDIDMMHVKKHFKYNVFEKLDAAAIQLPYKGSDLSMMIILPNKRNGLADLEAKLKETDLSKLSDEMYSQEVDVAIPKFKIEFEISLKKTLMKMGMGLIFSDNADFSNMLSGGHPLQVSEVIHKAFIDVNEEGAEAAAATAVLMAMCSMPLPSERFNANHSFIYTIWNQQSHEIIFVGRFIKPTDN